MRNEGTYIFLIIFKLLYNISNYKISIILFNFLYSILIFHINTHYLSITIYIWLNKYNVKITLNFTYNLRFHSRIRYTYNNDQILVFNMVPTAYSQSSPKSYLHIIPSYPKI